MRSGSWIRIILAAGMLSACALDDRDLASFQHSASGPEKLRALLRSRDRISTLRAAAALGLLDLEREDVDGRALLFSELNRLEPDGKRAILPAFQRGLSERMQTAQGVDPSPDAIRAKDAGARLLALLEPRERAELGAALLEFLAEDVPRRAARGEFSLERVASKVGPNSARALISALTERHDPVSFARIVKIVNAHAPQAERAHAAARVVELERAYRSQPAARAQAGDAAQSLLLATLGLFTDQPVVRARLISIAGSEAIALEERRSALMLLAGRVTLTELPALLSLAQAESLAPELRVLALSRAGETGSRSALPTFLVLLTDRTHHALRRRAGELSLSVGGAEAAGSFFRTMPTGWGMTYDKAEIDGYLERLVKLPPDHALLMLLGEKLHSSFWWNRVLALRYFASRGTAEDIWRIRQHVHDILPIMAAGYPRGHTVGLEAESALASAIERVHASAQR